jgi:hypothetical protein
MPLIVDDIAINATLEKIVKYVNKPDNLRQIGPSFAGVDNKELLPIGGYNFEWTCRKGGAPLKGKETVFKLMLRYS